MRSKLTLFAISATSIFAFAGCGAAVAPTASAGNIVNASAVQHQSRITPDVFSYDYSSGYTLYSNGYWTADSSGGQVARFRFYIAYADYATGAGSATTHATWTNDVSAPNLYKVTYYTDGNTVPNPFLSTGGGKGGNPADYYAKVQWNVNDGYQLVKAGDTCHWYGVNGGLLGTSLVTRDNYWYSCVASYNVSGNTGIFDWATAGVTSGSTGAVYSLTVSP